MTEAEEWYWDLGKNRAVRASERGLGAETLGPYASKFEAENWRDKVEERNDSWDDADDEWNDAPQSD
jgi:hypothetical protein